MVLSFIVLLAIKKMTGLRVTEEEEVGYSSENASLMNIATAEVGVLNLLSSAMVDLNAATNVYELRLHRDAWQSLWQRELQRIDVLDWNQQLNQWHDALIAETIRMSERQLEQEGWGTPPSRYAFVLFGSGGRGEQAMWSDQDHGLIMEDSTDPKATEYFMRLTNLIVDQLIVLGFPRCKGEVLSNNPLWCKTLQGWEEQLTTWMNDLSWENVRYLLIMADMRRIYGDEGLVLACRYMYTRLLEQSPCIGEAMLRNTLFYKASVNHFGQIIRERFGEFAGGVNLKYGAYIPLVNGIRYLALTSQSNPTDSGVHVPLQVFEQTSTWQRIQSLQHSNQKFKELIDRCEATFKSVLLRRAGIPFVMEEGQYVSHGYIEEYDLTREVARALKQELQVVHQLQRHLNKQIRIQLRNER
ncbi:DUF294 nucleotidyltransferase-like domain-containing protein [Paenibacillus selenitireducens]|nr:DUF294 nucleotidyltransferase-like domain-containing protein [Paenibacillus selenitireducens]